MSSPGLPMDVGWRQYPQTTSLGGAGGQVEVSSILRHALTKPRPVGQPPPSAQPPVQTTAYSCPTPSRVGQLPSPPISATSETVVATTAEDTENRVLLSNTERPSQQKPKYNFEAIKNYPPFRDAYNAALARRRSKSFGQGARQRSASESCQNSQWVSFEFGGHFL